MVLLMPSWRRYCHRSGGIIIIVVVLLVPSRRRHCHRGGGVVMVVPLMPSQRRDGGIADATVMVVATAREVSFEAVDTRAMPTDGGARARSEYVVLRGDSE